MKVNLKSFRNVMKDLFAAKSEGFFEVYPQRLFFQYLVENKSGAFIFFSEISKSFFVLGFPVLESDDLDSFCIELNLGDFEKNLVKLPPNLQNLELIRDGKPSSGQLLLKGENYPLFDYSFTSEVEELNLPDFRKICEQAYRNKLSDIPEILKNIFYIQHNGKHHFLSSDNITFVEYDFPSVSKTEKSAMICPFHIGLMAISTRANKKQSFSLSCEGNNFQMFVEQGKTFKVLVANYSGVSKNLIKEISPNNDIAIKMDAQIFWDLFYEHEKLTIINKKAQSHFVWDLVLNNGLIVDPLTEKIANTINRNELKSKKYRLHLRIPVSQLENILKSKNEQGLITFHFIEDAVSNTIITFSRKYSIEKLYIPKIAEPNGVLQREKVLLQRLKKNSKPVCISIGQSEYKLTPSIEGTLVSPDHEFLVEKSIISDCEKEVILAMLEENTKLLTEREKILTEKTKQLISSI